MDYLVHIVGPFLLGARGARHLNQRFRGFFVGFLAFFLAWIVMRTVATLAARALHVSESAFLDGLFVSVVAGLVEAGGFNLPRLPHAAPATKAWIVIILVGYSFLALPISHALQKTATPWPASPAAGPPSGMRPGRSAG